MTKRTMIETIRKALNEKEIYCEALDPHVLLVKENINSIFIIDEILNSSPISYKTSFFSTEESISFNYYINQSEVVIIEIKR